MRQRLKPNPRRRRLNQEMNLMRRLALGSLLVTSLVLLGARAGWAAVPDGPLAEGFLLDGKLAEGEAALAAALEKDPGDGQARFGLGATQFLRGVERMAQSLYRYGLRDPAGGMVPFLRLPVPMNPAPEAVRKEDLRGVLTAWVEDMTRAEATLAKVEDPEVKLPLHFARIRLDLDGDGQATEDERLWRVYARFNRQAGAGGGRNDDDEDVDDGIKNLVIAFDRGDVAWLRGYCHLLTAMAEVILAHDGGELFDHTAHLAFARPETPFGDFLRSRREGEANRFDTFEIADLIAAVHLVRLPVVEPKRMATALGHLEAMIGLSRESWRFYEQETDDDHEWIPNPKQRSVVPGVRVTAEMIGAWKEFLDEAEGLLAGKRLAPFWRASDSRRGVNLRRVFVEPRTFDLVLWAQGTAAVPYLEEGPMTRPEVWSRLQRVFAGEFVGFALWFN
jgi:hypothetical protein